MKKIIEKNIVGDLGEDRSEARLIVKQLHVGMEFH